MEILQTGRGLYTRLKILTLTCLQYLNCVASVCTRAQIEQDSRLRRHKICPTLDDTQQRHSPGAQCCTHALVRIQGRVTSLLPA